MQSQKFSKESQGNEPGCRTAASAGPRTPDPGPRTPDPGPREEGSGFTAKAVGTGALLSLCIAGVWLVVDYFAGMTDNVVFWI